MRLQKTFLMALAVCAALAGCKKDDDDEPCNCLPEEPRIQFTLALDSTQARLNNLGQPAAIPAGHAGQHPRFNGLAIHYIELSQDQNTLPGNGLVLYQSPTRTEGGVNSIWFDSLNIVNHGQTLFSAPFSALQTGTYKYVRISLAYQNYDIDVHTNGFTVPGTVASFVGYRQYIRTVQVGDSTLTVNANRDQGFWAFATAYSLNSGQAPGTTVPNPIAATSPIPAGSCLVTGQLAQPLEIDLANPRNLNIRASFSTNRSFEWEDGNGNGLFEPMLGEAVVDMGIRGLEAEVID